MKIFRVSVFLVRKLSNLSNMMGWALSNTNVLIWYHFYRSSRLHEIDVVKFAYIKQMAQWKHNLFIFTVQLVRHHITTASVRSKGRTRKEIYAPIIALS